MTSNELKELVKQHFSLTEAPTEAVVEETSNETFGEIMDENKAFTIIFPGDELKVGSEVRVRTADGQELTAPDGEHRLEDGAVIKVEDGKVVEYTSEAEIEKREGEELAIDGEVEQPAQSVHAWRNVRGIRRSGRHGYGYGRTRRHGRRRTSRRRWTRGRGCRCGRTRRPGPTKTGNLITDAHRRENRFAEGCRRVARIAKEPGRKRR